MNGDRLHISHEYDPGSTYHQGWVRPDVWRPGTPTGAVTPATSPPTQQQPLPWPTPPGPQDDPVAAEGDVSVLDLYSPLASPAPTVSPKATSDIGGLGKHREAGIWKGTH